MPKCNWEPPPGVQRDRQKLLRRQPGPEAQALRLEPKTATCSWEEAPSASERNNGRSRTAPGSDISCGLSALSMDCFGDFFAVDGILSVVGLLAVLMVTLYWGRVCNERPVSLQTGVGGGGG